MDLRGGVRREEVHAQHGNTTSATDGMDAVKPSPVDVADAFRAGAGEADEDLRRRIRFGRDRDKGFYEERAVFCWRVGREIVDSGVSHRARCRVAQDDEGAALATVLGRDDQIKVVTYGCGADELWCFHTQSIPERASTVLVVHRPEPEGTSFPQLKVSGG